LNSGDWFDFLCVISYNWYLVLGGVAVGREFEPQSDLLELSFAKILIKLSISSTVSFLTNTVTEQ
jgi:hypothetical protein